MTSTFLHSLYLIPAETSAWGGWAYVFIALLVAVEGPITTLVGAVAASTGYLNPVLVFVAAGTGNLTADILWYSLGYLGKIEWLVHYGGWLGIRESSLARLQQDVHTHIHKILFIAKLTLGFVVPTLIAAGLARVPFKRWFGVLFAAECLWTGSLVLVGYYFGYMTQSIETSLPWVSAAGAVAFIAVVSYYLFHHRPKLEQDP